MELIVQHSSKTQEHYTPTSIVESARLVMGGIDLDPASTRIVNEQRVKAEVFYSKEFDGLSGAWRGRVFLNPPGGKTKNKSNAAIWWNKLVGEYLEGRVHTAIFIGFTLEVFATSQDSPLWIGDVPFCVPRARIAFDDEFLEPGASPPHSNVIAYLGPNVDAFTTEFSKYGRVSSLSTL